MGTWLVVANLADAAPVDLGLGRRQNDHQQASSNRNDDSSEDGSSVSPAVWVSLSALFLVFAIGDVGRPFVCCMTLVAPLDRFLKADWAAV